MPVAMQCAGQGTSEIPDPRALQTVLPFGLGQWDWRRRGINLKNGNEIYIAPKKKKIYIAPSGVQKEPIQPGDMFVTSMNRPQVAFTI